MATIEKRQNGYRLVFWYRGERFQGAIKTDKETKADELKKRVEGNLELLLQGRLEYRPGTDDLFTLMLSDGRLNAKPEAARPLTLSDFFQKYAENPSPSKEQNTAYTEKIHADHLLRLLGKGTLLADVPRKLQDYVNARSKEDGLRGDTVSHVTIRKELGTLSSIWNKWGMNRQLVPVPLSLRNLEYPKRTEKELFQTWEQIERRIARGKLTPEQQEQAWGSLFLTLQEVGELLAHVEKSKFPWAYPMFVFCAHTGARRSEMLRSRVEDFDFDRNEVTIREKKKDRTKKETLRQVPMTPLLRKAMLNWLRPGVHAGGEVMFCKTANEPFTEQMASHYFRWVLEGSKWAVIRGWHCLRHSFVSNLACRGIDERMIMKLVGHLNPETTRRYQHLFPSTVHDAMQLVFGDR